MEISHLSDEVLVYIFNYLPGVDKINISLTCKRFNEILLEKRLIRNLNFATAYKLTSSQLKMFLKPKLRYDNVRSLDVSNCYWISATELLPCITKMKNLHSLNIIGTVLQFMHLDTIMNALRSLVRLSCSSLKPGNVGLIECNGSSLEYLYIQDRTWSFVTVCDFLYVCPNLRELWIKCITKEPDTLLRLSLFLRLKSLRGAVQLPLLHTLVLQADDSESKDNIVSLYIQIFVEIILMATMDSTIDMRLYWANAHLFKAPRNVELPLERVSNAIAFAAPSNLFSMNQNLVDIDFKQLQYIGVRCKPKELLPVWREKLTEMNITHLEWAAGILESPLPETLTHLTVRTCCTEEAGEIGKLGTLKNLRSLSMPLCYFHVYDTEAEKTPFQLQQTGTGTKRVSRVLVAPTSDSALEKFTRTCPDLQHLNLFLCAMNLYSSPHSASPTDLASLSSISAWKHLRMLSLSDIKCYDHSFLVQVARSCPFLEKLTIKYVSSCGLHEYVGSLTKAFLYCKRLKDFRLEEQHVGNLMTLLTGLQQCSSLERAVIISPNATDPLCEESCINFIDKCTSLVLFYASLSSVTQIAMQKFAKTVRNRYAHSRPALCAQLQKYSTAISDYHNVPDIHFVEIIKSPQQQFDVFPKPEGPS